MSSVTPIPHSHNGLPSTPQTGAIVREWDRRAIEEYGIPAVVLMENAGAGAARVVRDLALALPQIYPEPFCIFCGPGNNGGDGFVVARYLNNYGFDVQLRICGQPTYRPGSETAVQREIVHRLGLPLKHSGTAEDAAGEAEEADGTAIDALFGTGLSRTIGSPFAECIAAINRRPGATIALDLPTGLDADTGAVHGIAIEARNTITFAARKQGLSRGEGPRLSGEVHVLDIGLPPVLWTDKT